MSHYYFQFICVFLFFVKTGCSSISRMTQQDGPFFAHQFNAQDKISLNLEELSNVNLLSKTHLQSCSGCELNPPIFTTEAKTSYHGYFGSSQTAFYYDNKFFVYELVPDRFEAFLTYCDVKLSDSESPRAYFVVRSKEVYMNYEMKDHNIVEMKLFDQLLSIRTKQELVFYRFDPDSAIPRYIYNLLIKDLDVTDYYVNIDMSIFLTNSTSIIKSSLHQIEDGKIGQIQPSDLVYKFYETPDGELYPITESSGGFTVCENIAFFTEKNKILAFDMNQQGEKLIILRESIEEDDILKIKKFGRSLLVLTNMELIEYIFINDCLDMKKNKVIPFKHLGLAVSEGIQENLILEGEDSDSSYYIVLNKLTDTVYVFQSAAIQDVLPTPYIYSYSDPINGIIAAKVQEQYDEYHQAQIRLSIVQKENVVTSITINKVPESVECQSWISKTEVCSIDLELNFCSNEMYNYTALLKSSRNTPNDLGIEIDNKIYFDPNHRCKRVVQLEVKFGWSYTFLGVASGSIFGIVATVIMGFLFCRKKKKLLEIKKEHVKFNNEDKSFGVSENNFELTLGATATNNNVELTLGATVTATATDRPIRIVHQHTKMAQNNNKWKNQAEKKHLTVKHLVQTDLNK